MRQHRMRAQQKRKGGNKNNSPPDVHDVILQAKAIYSVSQSLTADYTHLAFFKYMLKNKIRVCANPPSFRSRHHANNPARHFSESRVE
jgi:hypothetical protein